MKTPVLKVDLVDEGLEIENFKAPAEEAMSRIQAFVLRAAVRGERSIAINVEPVTELTTYRR